MPTKKKPGKKAHLNGVAISEVVATELVQISGDNLVVTIQQDKSKPPRPIRLPGETEEARANRLAKRRALTSITFHLAYEDHQRRKKSQEGEKAMTGLEVLQSVQFVTVKDKRLAVLSADDWEALVEWIENLEDAKIARQAIDELKAAQGDRQRAGWLGWEQAEAQLT